MTFEHELKQFKQLAQAAGWYFVGVQDPIIPELMPTLVLTRGNKTNFISFQPETFDPVQIAKTHLSAEEPAMTDTPKLNLRQKMIQIYNEIDHVGKYGENTKQKYNFVRAADVMRPVRDAFAKWGVYAETNYELLGTYDIKTNSGGTMHTATVKATIVLHDADSDETLTISGLGDGADGGDKGIYKAMTGSTKNALRNGCLLPDEADPEADENVDTRTQAQLPDYTDFRGTEAMPDFQKPRHAAPKAPAAPKSEKMVYIPDASPKAASEAPDAAFDPKTAYSEATAALVTPPAAPEHGDAWEEPEVQRLPTEDEMAAYRKRFVELSNELSAHGKLTASKGLKTNTKLQVFLLSITKADAAKSITVDGWNDFFRRADAAIANPAIGLTGLTKLVNQANGIESKQ